MSDEKKEPSPMKNPIAWVFRASVLLLGAVIALNVAIAYLQPILPWIIGGIALAAVGWLVVAIIRWRRSRW
jgi:membrane protein YdbS with pleckstrin-like domain